MKLNRFGLHLGLVMLSALLSVPVPASADAFVDRFVATSPRQIHQCTADGAWCIKTSKTRMTVLARSANGTLVERVRLDMTNDEERMTESKPWMSLIRSPQGGNTEQVLVGIEERRSESYSGGSGSLTELHLYAVGSGRNASSMTPQLSIPLTSSFMVRACFSPQDEKSRRGACHDEYTFAGELKAARSRRSGEVSLVLQGRAESYPGHRSRMDDSSQQPPLRKSDLVWALDAECSFQRYIRWNTSTVTVSWSRPLPACEDYLQLQ